MKPFSIFALAFALCLVFCAAARAQFAGQSVKGFRLPEYNADGTLRQNLLGTTATLLEGGIVQLSGLQIEFYNHGVLTARATADDCALDQHNKRAASRSHLRIVTERGILSGDGFAWNGENEQFQIFDNVRVVLDTSGADIQDQLMPKAVAAEPAPAGDAAPDAPAPQQETP